MQVGIRELRNRLSEYVERIKGGAEVTVTERGRAVAVMRPAAPRPGAGDVWRWAADGLVVWNGGRPHGCERPPRVAAGRAAAIVLEDRR